ncbi:class I SAM-dependent methyltransferase [Sphingorhabdus pulchriflava]|nr:class I SAM-dependent methyltransferase [Sphingorhabdus pulchriflava]
MTEFIYTRPETCTACGAGLHLWRQNVRDGVYGVDGIWNLHRCNNSECAASYLDARLSASQLAGFYETYSTHHDPVFAANGTKLIFRQALEWLFHRRLGYRRPKTSTLLATLARFFELVPLLREMALSRVFWLPYVAGGKLVEIGFGNAQTLLQMRELGWEVEGVEFDEMCIRKARALGFNVKQGDFESQDYPDGSMNAVVGSHVIEHVPDPGKLMATIYNKLQPGGRMVLVTPNGASWGCRLMGAYWRGLEVPRHLTIQTPSSLIRHARRAGFKKIELSGTPLGGGILQQSLRLRLGKPINGSGRLPQLFWASLASMIHLLRPQASDEIVMICEK